jgi:hypothetical protein
MKAELKNRLLTFLAEAKNVLPVPFFNFAENLEKEVKQTPETKTETKTEE